jgi:hypothetical protein
MRVFWNLGSFCTIRLRAEAVAKEAGGAHFARCARIPRVSHLTKELGLFRRISDGRSLSRDEWSAWFGAQHVGEDAHDG